MLTSIEVDDTKVQAKLGSLQDRVRAALTAKTWSLTKQLEARVKAKLNGIVLHVRSSNLRRSIFSDVESGSDSITGKVASSGDVKYAGIHEYGGTINVPEIVPVKAKALHFLVGGKDVFATRARAHTVNMPERSFLRSSLAEMKQQIIDGLTQTAKRAAAGK